MAHVLYMLLPMCLSGANTDQECQGNECPAKVNFLLQVGDRGVKQYSYSDVESALGLGDDHHKGAQNHSKQEVSSDGSEKTECNGVRCESKPCLNYPRTKNQDCVADSDRNAHNMGCKCHLRCDGHIVDRKYGKCKDINSATPAPAPPKYDNRKNRREMSGPQLADYCPRRGKLTPGLWGYAPCLSEKRVRQVCVRDNFVSATHSDRYETVKNWGCDLSRGHRCWTGWEAGFWGEAQGLVFKEEIWAAGWTESKDGVIKEAGEPGGDINEVDFGFCYKAQRASFGDTCVFRCDGEKCPICEAGYCSYDAFASLSEIYNRNDPSIASGLCCNYDKDPDYDFQNWGGLCCKEGERNTNGICCKKGKKNRNGRCSIY